MRREGNPPPFHLLILFPPRPPAAPGRPLLYIDTTQHIYTRTHTHAHGSVGRVAVVAIYTSKHHTLHVYTHTSRHINPSFIHRTRIFTHMNEGGGLDLGFVSKRKGLYFLCAVCCCFFPPSGPTKKNEVPTEQKKARKGRKEGRKREQLDGGWDRRMQGTTTAAVAAPPLCVHTVWRMAGGGEGAGGGVFAFFSSKKGASRARGLRGKATGRGGRGKGRGNKRRKGERRKWEKRRRFCFQERASAQLLLFCRSFFSFLCGYGGVVIGGVGGIVFSCSLTFFSMRTFAPSFILPVIIVVACIFALSKHFLPHSHTQAMEAALALASTIPRFSQSSPHVHAPPQQPWPPWVKIDFWFLSPQAKCTHAPARSPRPKSAARHTLSIQLHGLRQSVRGGFPTHLLIRKLMITYGRRPVSAATPRRRR